MQKLISPWITRLEKKASAVYERTTQNWTGGHNNLQRLNPPGPVVVGACFQWTDCDDASEVELAEGSAWSDRTCCVGSWWSCRMPNHAASNSYRRLDISNAAATAGLVALCVCGTRAVIKNTMQHHRSSSSRVATTTVRPIIESGLWARSGSTLTPPRPGYRPRSRRRSIREGSSSPSPPPF